MPLHPALLTFLKNAAEGIDQPPVISILIRRDGDDVVYFPEQEEPIEIVNVEDVDDEVDDDLVIVEHEEDEVEYTGFELDNMQAAHVIADPHPQIIEALGAEPALPAESRAAIDVVQRRIEQLNEQQPNIDGELYWQELQRLQKRARLLAKPDFVVGCQELPYGRTAKDTRILLTAGPFEVYLKKDNATGQTRPVNRDLPVNREPTAMNSLKLPEGLTNNFAFWNTNDVMRWARLFIRSQESLRILELHRLNGLGVYYVTRQNQKGPLFFKKRSPERAAVVRVDAPKPSADVPALPVALKKRLRENIDKLFNVLNGSAP